MGYDSRQQLRGGRATTSTLPVRSQAEDEEELRAEMEDAHVKISYSSPPYG